MALSIPTGEPFYRDPTTTEAFRALRHAKPLSFEKNPTKAVVIGGGTGAPVTIQTLISLGFETNAIVSMADDGGSTGIIRKRTDATPPGDVRKCLAAFAADAHDPMTLAFQTRFSFADGHALGNLLMSALEDITGDFNEAVHLCEDLLHARGHVLPSTLTHVELHAETTSGAHLIGQSIASLSTDPLRSVWLVAEDEIEPNPDAISAIEEADLIALGPGSLFTSIIPNLCVPGIIEAIAKSEGKVVFVSPIADMQGETKGMKAIDLIEALFSHGLMGLLDFVVANDYYPDVTIKNASGRVVSIDYVPINDEVVAGLQERGVDVVVANLVSKDAPTWHNPNALASALSEVAEKCLLLRM